MKTRKSVLKGLITRFNGRVDELRSEAENLKKRILEIDDRYANVRIHAARNEEYLLDQIAPDYLIYLYMLKLSFKHVLAFGDALASNKMMHYCLVKTKGFIKQELQEDIDVIESFFADDATLHILHQEHDELEKKLSIVKKKLSDYQKEYDELEAYGDELSEAIGEEYLTVKDAS